MPKKLPVGPYRNIQLADGTTVPYYIIPYDKRGICEGPSTLEHLLNSIKQDTYTDILIFSHGWNNDWTVATNRYEDFMKGYMKMRQDNDLSMSVNYKPLLIGIYWPSTALVFTENEVGPDIASVNNSDIDQLVGDEQSFLRELADKIENDDDVNSFYELIQKDMLTENDARKLADITKVLYQNNDDELHFNEAITTDEILSIWEASNDNPTDFGDFGTVGDDDSSSPQAAGFGDIIKKFDPRHIIRMLTVYQMKDRAGKVGGYGVSKLLRKVLDLNNARVHMIGHSYGAKVVLSAISFGENLPRKVESMLLLQPAVSHLCFAENVPSTTYSGGYYPALYRVNKPILTTYSKHDFPLTKTFHIALRRKGDLGELSIAAAGEPPSKYAALGGYGPRKCGQILIDIHDVNEPYDLNVDNRIIGLCSDGAINSHGDISNLSTWWALYCLVST